MAKRFAHYEREARSLIRRIIWLSHHVRVPAVKSAPPKTIVADEAATRAEWSNIFFIQPIGQCSVRHVNEVEGEIALFARRCGRRVNVVIVIDPGAPIPDTAPRMAIQALMRNRELDIASTVLLVRAEGFGGSAVLSVGAAIFGGLGLKTLVTRNSSQAASRIMDSPVPPDAQEPELKCVIDELGQDRASSQMTASFRAAVESPASRRAAGPGRAWTDARSQSVRTGRRAANRLMGR